ncbi:MAG: PAS domain S-box protein [Coleofasciculaceae cyanobacterium SM2_3_26]|nr:PAS domain S-box protein [Coleofasciculaceae cyanobacterium SM2_3_26]
MAATNGSSIAVRRLWDEDGVPIRMVGSLSDITSRKQAEAALRASQRRMSTLIQQTPLAIIEWNVDFEVVAWNLAAETIFGYSAEEAIGQQGFDFIVPETDRGQVRQVFEMVRLQRGGDCNLNRNLRQDGTEIVCQWYNSSLMDDSGNVIGFVAMGMDVTTEHQAEIALAESEAKFRALFERAGVGMSVVDLGGRLLEVNPAMHRILGYAEAGLLGAHISEYSHPEDWEIDSAKLQQVHAGSLDFYQMEKRYYRKNGEMIWANLHVFSVKRAGKVEFTFGIMEDISDRRRAEEKLRQSEAQMRAILAAIPDLMFRLSGDGIYLGYVTTNRSIDLLPIDSDPMGKHLSEIVPLELGERHIRYARQVLATGQPKVTNSRTG